MVGKNDNEICNCVPGGGGGGPATPSVTLDIRKANVGTWEESVSVNTNEDVELRWSSSNATRCIGDSYFSTGSGSPTSGTQQTVSEPVSGDRTYTARCYNGPSDSDPSATDTVVVTVIENEPEISAVPGLIDYGTTSTIVWELNQHEGCSISATNNDSIGDDPLTEDGSEETIDIYGQVIYTILCSDTGSSDTAEVEVRPFIEEI